jgi:hypothetical protein
MGSPLNIQETRVVHDSYVLLEIIAERLEKGDADKLDPKVIRARAQSLKTVWVMKGKYQ